MKRKILSIAAAFISIQFAASISHPVDPVAEASSSVASSRIFQMSHANGTIKFDPNYGGAIVSASNKGHEMVDSTDYGRLWQMAIGIGNDPTQASSNGVQKNRIKVYGDTASSIYQYYGEELQATSTRYHVALHAPLWIAQIAQESIPELSVAGNLTNPAFNVFRATGSTTAWPNMTNNPSSITKYQFYDGKVAVKAEGKVTAANTADNWFGIQFRQTASGDGINQSGYLALLRYDGTLDLLKASSSGPQLLGRVNTGLAVLNQTYQIEVRTAGSNLQVWLDDVKKIDVTDAGYNGNYAAIVNFNNNVDWRNLGFYDMGIQFDSDTVYDPVTNLFSMTTKVNNFSSAVRPIDGDFVQMPIFFMNRPGDPTLNKLYYRTSSTGSWTNYAGPDRHWKMDPSQANYAYEFLIGNDQNPGYSLVFRSLSTGAHDQYRLVDNAEVYAMIIENDVNGGGTPPYVATLGTTNPARSITTSFYLF
ncbi:hypothetical protein [Cohnella sp. GCM10012308]|uniref:hypothetical protein n=1 Tax=Cohnella sp. GCM10012308 TaxID=3317329 RepID=UPI003619B681